MKGLKLKIIFDHKGCGSLVKAENCDFIEGVEEIDILSKAGDTPARIVLTLFADEVDLEIKE